MVGSARLFLPPPGHQDVYPGNQESQACDEGPEPENDHQHDAIKYPDKYLGPLPILRVICIQANGIHRELFALYRGHWTSALAAEREVIRYVLSTESTIRRITAITTHGTDKNLS